MTWTVVFTVSDCKTKQPLAAVVSDNIKAVASAPGQYELTTDADAYNVLVQAAGDGYVSKTVTFYPSQAGTVQNICLDEVPPAPPPAPVDPPSITSYYVKGGVLTVDFSSADAHSFNINLVALDGPFPGQPNGKSREIDGGDRRCIWEQVPGGHRYRFSIERCLKWGIENSRCSAIVSVDFDVSLDTGWVPPMQKVHSVSCNSNQIDVVAVAADQQVWTRRWAAAPWSPWRPIGFQFPAGNVVTAVSRNPNQIDLFAIGGNGHVYTSWWTNGSDWTGLKGWRDIGFQFPAGNTVTAVSRNPNQIDLFAIAGNGHVYTSWWTNGGDWSGLKGWRDIGGVFPAGAAVSAVSRNPNQIDLFVVHGDGVVYTTWWTAGADWVPWHPVAA
jgi:hypothetical protein